jgi:beta-lactamase superfamily II metal-dependent hydrolase
MNQRRLGFQETTFNSAIRFGLVAIGSACLSSCVTPQPESVKPLQIVSIDVDGGAATLYITPEGKSLLIDSGWPAGRGGARRAPGSVPPAAPAAAPAAPDPSSADRIVAAARKAGLTRLDYVLITHYHVDHVGGLGELLGKFPVDTILDHGPNRELVPDPVNPGPVASQPTTLYAAYEVLIAGRYHQSLKTGDKIALGSVTLTVVTSDREAPRRPLPGAGQVSSDCDSMSAKSVNGGEENARSVGLLLTYGSARVVSLGDLTWDVERELVCPVNRIGRADLFFVSNHGTLNNSPALLHALKPRVAIMNNGLRKGGDPDTYDTVSASPGLQRFWQLHFSTKGGVAHNPGDAYIANLTDDPDQYAALYVSVFPDGRITILNGRTGFSESYPAANTRSAGK